MCLYLFEDGASYQKGAEQKQIMFRLSLGDRVEKKVCIYHSFNGGGHHSGLKPLGIFYLSNFLCNDGTCLTVLILVGKSVMMVDRSAQRRRKIKLQRGTA